MLNFPKEKINLIQSNWNWQSHEMEIEMAKQMKIREKEKHWVVTAAR